MAGEKAAQDAAELIRKADKAFLEENLVVPQHGFRPLIRNLMARHGCNAFTIDCFEFCPSMLPQRWLVTPCLLLAAFGNEGIAAACEAVFGVSAGRPPVDERIEQIVSPGQRRPAGRRHVPHQSQCPELEDERHRLARLAVLGRFVQQGWGTKAVIDFMNNKEKTVTVRVSTRLRPSSWCSKARWSAPAVGDRI